MAGMNNYGNNYNNNPWGSPSGNNIDLAKNPVKNIYNELQKNPNQYNKVTGQKGFLPQQTGSGTGGQK